MPKRKKSIKNKTISQNIIQNGSIADEVQELIIAGTDQFNEGFLTESGLTITKALQIDPDNFHGWNILGAIALSLDEYARAQQYFERAIEIDDKASIAHFNLALVLLELNNTKGAIDALRIAIKLQSNYTEAWSTLGLIHNQMHEWEAAREAFEKALATNANYSPAWVNLCGSLLKLELFDDAIEAGLKGVTLSPEIAESHYNLGTAFNGKEYWEKAIDSFDNAIAINSNYAASYSEKCVSLCHIGKAAEAEECVLRAIEISPFYAEAHSNLGLAKYNQNDLNAAIGHYQKSIELDPENDCAHNNLSYAQLTLEMFLTGWDEYEYGFPEKQRDPVTETHAPIWKGQSLKGKKIHVHGEQGVGEQIMFSTMLPDLISSGAKVVYECDTRLSPIFERSCSDIIIAPKTIPTDPRVLSKDIDYRINAGSLGMYFRRSVNDFSPRGKFLNADQDLVEKYRKTFNKLGSGFKIGISWKSVSPRYSVKKNTSLEMWRPILETPNCYFISLQYGDVEGDVKMIKENFGIDIFVDPDVSVLNSLEQSAAQVSAVDLVISISNATVHMSAACGTKTWMLLSEHSLWHWFLNREDSLWYKHIKKFRPNKDQTIEATIELVSKELPKYLETLS